MRRTVFVLAVLCGASCATHPKNVEPESVSVSTKKMYESMSCKEVAYELDLAQGRHDALWNKQKGNRTRDGLLNALVLPGLGAATSDHEAELAKAKGSVLALEREYAERCLG